MPHLPEVQFTAPSELWLKSRTLALETARLNVQELEHFSRVLHARAWNRYPLYSIEQHAAVVRMCSAEWIIALWCENEIARAAGVLDAGEPLAPDTDVDIPKALRRLLPKETIP